MQKVPSLFLRDPADMAVLTREPNPLAQWVFDGEGQPTRKYDGTCVALDAYGSWWARREVKPGKSAPPNWVEVDVDAVTEKRMGWEPIEQSGFRKAHAEALTYGPMTRYGMDRTFPVGTYELCGPKVGGNPECYVQHVLIPHAQAEVPLLGIMNGPGARDYSFDGVRWLIDALATRGWEGLVWHHADGRMAKIKHRDFANVAPA